MTYWSTIIYDQINWQAIVMSIYGKFDWRWTLCSTWHWWGNSQDSSHFLGNRHAFLKTVPRKYLNSPQYWLVVRKIFYFPFHIRDVILPVDELILFKMVIAPPILVGKAAIAEGSHCVLAKCSLPARCLRVIRQWHPTKHLLWDWCPMLPILIITESVVSVGDYIYPLHTYNII